MLFESLFLFLVVCAFLQHPCHFLHEGGEVGELAVDGGEADIGDIVQFFERLHDRLTDLAGGDFFLKGVIGELFHRGDNLLDFGSGNGALMAGGNDAVADFLRIEQLPRLILFDDQKLLLFDFFVSCEAAAAVDAFTAAANAGAVIGWP